MTEINRLALKCIYIGNSDKIVTKSVGVKARCVYKCNFYAAMLNNDNHVRFICSVPVNGKASDERNERNSVSACARVTTPIADPQAGYKNRRAFLFFKLLLRITL